jgi:CRISPR-associated protein Csb1
MSSIEIDRLIAACSDAGADAGINITTTLEPLGGPGSKVKPATYAGGLFQIGRRWWGEGDARRVVDVIGIDNEPSQANRLEAALESMRADLGLPELVLDLSGLEPLPPHVPRSLSIFRFPHRNADAYLRDAVLDGTEFLKSDIGRGIFSATADKADALMQWCPQALLFGFWQSHLGKKGSQAKSARSWTSEIIGIEPAASDVRSLGLKGDPLNLNIIEKVEVPDDFSEAWDLGAKGKKKLSDIGHGQVPVTGDDASLSGVSFRELVQQSTVSFAGLRHVYTSAGSAEARALLVCLGLVAHARAFGRSFQLRSGCDLRPVSATWRWMGDTGDETIDRLTTDDANALFMQAVQRAESAGLPVGNEWSDPVVLTPKANLAKAIRSTFPTPDSE